MTLKQIESAAEGFQKVMAAWPKVCVLGREDYDELKLELLGKESSVSQETKDIVIYEGMRLRGITFGV